MASRTTLMHMPTEIISVIFAHVYSLAILSFDTSVTYYLHIYDARRPIDWLPGEYMAPMLICKFLKPIAQHAFLTMANFHLKVSPIFEDADYAGSGWSTRSHIKDPICLARSIKCNYALAFGLSDYWYPHQYPLARVKNILLVDTFNFRSPIPNIDRLVIEMIAKIDYLAFMCMKNGIKFQAQLILRARKFQHRDRNAYCVWTDHDQDVSITMHKNATVTLNRIENAHYTFYEYVKRVVRLGTMRYEQPEGFELPAISPANDSPLINFPAKSDESNESVEVVKVAHYVPWVNKRPASEMSQSKYGTSYVKCKVNIHTKPREADTAIEA